MHYYMPYFDLSNDFITNQMQNNLYPCLENKISGIDSRWRNPDLVPKTGFTTEEAVRIAHALNIDFSKEKFDVEQFRMGLDVELEHGTRDPQTNVTNDDPILTGKIALAHLREFPDYYTRLAKLEDEAKEYWSTRGNFCWQARI